MTDTDEATADELSAAAVVGEERLTNYQQNKEAQQTSLQIPRLDGSQRRCSEGQRVEQQRGLRQWLAAPSLEVKCAPGNRHSSSKPATEGWGDWERPSASSNTLYVPVRLSASQSPLRSRRRTTAPPVLHILA